MAHPFVEERVFEKISLAACGGIGWWTMHLTD
jgi:hypothetical protein